MTQKERFELAYWVAKWFWCPWSFAELEAYEDFKNYEGQSLEEWWDWMVTEMDRSPDDYEPFFSGDDAAENFIATMLSPWAFDLIMRKEAESDSWKIFAPIWACDREDVPPWHCQFERCEGQGYDPYRAFFIAYKAAKEGK